MGKSPDAFRTISEVADWLDTQAHVLRFWESKFTQVKPVKRAGGRRYYRPADMLLLGGIKKLLHDDGMTIKGAQKLLREKGTKYVAGLSQPLEGEDETAIEEDIGLTEVPPAPLEEERGRVLSFERREEAEAPQAEDQDHVEEAAPAAEDPTPVQEPEPEADTPEDETDLPEETVPSFVQRLTPSAASEEEVAEETPTLEPEPEAETASAAAPDTEATTEDASTDDTSEDAEEDAEGDTDDQPHSAEPDQSLLADIAGMTGIAPENRADVTAALDRLAALCARIEAAENA